MKEIAKVSWKSPSNIAFIKYWGKYGIQFPQNPSLSMTLDKCCTETSITMYPKTGHQDVEFDFLFHGKEKPSFSARLSEYLNSLKKELRFLSDYKLLIKSENSFPHSAGIASSASAMSALALCLASLEQRLGTTGDVDLYQHASILARLGSGSASRSIYKKYVVWGEADSVPGSSNAYAKELTTPIHGLFLDLRDTILLIDKSTKKVSSRAGHSLMNGHPYANQRFKSARENLNSLLRCMENGDFETFTFLLEHEALSLHAMMMTANPWYTLLTPNSLAILQRVKEYREETKIQLAFTLDAGPNIHLIYPTEAEQKVQQFVKSELTNYCQDEKTISDNIGPGPDLLVDEFYE